MVEAETGQKVEPARFRNEQSRPEGKIRRIVRGLMRPFRRKIPEQALVDPEAVAAAARAEGGPTHEERVKEAGCLYRALISAAGNALKPLGRKQHKTEEEAGEKAKGEQWALAMEQTKKILAKLQRKQVVPTKEEHEMRFSDIDQGAKDVSELNQDVLNLVEKLKTPPEPTDMSELLNAVTLSQPRTVKSKEEIFDLMVDGQQVLVFTSDENPKLSHIFHAGRRGQTLISQSDGKKEVKNKFGKRLKQFGEAKLNKPPYTVFLVSPKPASLPAEAITQSDAPAIPADISSLGEAPPIPANARRKDHKLAA